MPDIVIFKMLATCAKREDKAGVDGLISEYFANIEHKITTVDVHDNAMLTLFRDTSDDEKRYTNIIEYTNFLEWIDQVEKDTTQIMKNSAENLAQWEHKISQINKQITSDDTSKTSKKLLSLKGQKARNSKTDISKPLASQHIEKNERKTVSELELESELESIFNTNILKIQLTEVASKKNQQLIDIIKKFLEEFIKIEQHLKKAESLQLEENKQPEQAIPLNEKKQTTEETFFNFGQITDDIIRQKAIAHLKSIKKKIDLGSLLFGLNDSAEQLNDLIAKIHFDIAADSRKELARIATESNELQNQFNETDLYKKNITKQTSAPYNNITAREEVLKTLLNDLKHADSPELLSIALSKARYSEHGDETETNKRTVISVANYLEFKKYDLKECYVFIEKDNQLFFIDKDKQHKEITRNPMKLDSFKKLTNPSKTAKKLSQEELQKILSITEVPISLTEFEIVMNDIESHFKKPSFNLKTGKKAIFECTKKHLDFCDKEKKRVKKLRDSLETKSKLDQATSAVNRAEKKHQAKLEAFENLSNKLKHETTKFSEAKKRKDAEKDTEIEKQMQEILSASKNQGKTINTSKEHRLLDEKYFQRLESDILAEDNPIFKALPEKATADPLYNRIKVKLKDTILPRVEQDQKTVNALLEADEKKYEYALAPLADLKGDNNKAEPGKIYLNKEKHEYTVRVTKKLVRTGKLPTEIKLDNLSNPFTTDTDQAGLSEILKFTSKIEHTHSKRKTINLKIKSRILSNIEEQINDLSKEIDMYGLDPSVHLAEILNEKIASMYRNALINKVTLEELRLGIGSRVGTFFRYEASETRRINNELIKVLEEMQPLLKEHTATLDKNNFIFGYSNNNE